MGDRSAHIWVVGEPGGVGGFLSSHLGGYQGLDVLWRSYNVQDAMLRMPTYRPDVVVVDASTNEPEALRFVRWLRAQTTTPTLCVCAHAVDADLLSRSVQCDVVARPAGSEFAALSAMNEEIAMRLQALTTHALRPELARSLQTMTFRGIIAIGASTGGTEATCALLTSLPQGMPGMVIVQHMPEGFTGMYAERLTRSTRHRVREASGTQSLRAGDVLLAPGNQQMRVVKRSGAYQVECYDGDRVSGHKPSVDVLFQSVALAAGKEAIGVILTGMGGDGAAGLLAMRRAGAYTIGQDRESSTVYGMPKVAFDMGAVQAQASLNEIPTLITKRLYA